MWSNREWRQQIKGHVAPNSWRKWDERDWLSRQEGRGGGGPCQNQSKSRCAFFFRLLGKHSWAREKVLSSRQGCLLQITHTRVNWIKKKTGRSTRLWVRSLLGPGAVLLGVCMFFPCLCGISAGSPQHCKNVLVRLMRFLCSPAGNQQVV